MAYKGKGHVVTSIPFRRSIVYELLAHAFSEPSGDFLDFFMEEETLLLIKDALSIHPNGSDIDMNPLKEALSEAGRYGFAELVSSYERLASHEHNCFYECNYYPPLISSEEMADVAGFYRAFHLGFSGDRPDHISSELEFMRLLTLKEARAEMEKDTENIEVCRSAQEKFLSSHLGRLAKVLQRMTDNALVYGPMGKFLSSWIGAECRYLSAEPDEIFFDLRRNNDGEHIACTHKGGEA